MVVAAGQAVLLAFVDVGDCGIPKVLRELFFFPHGLEEGDTTCIVHLSRDGVRSWGFPSGHLLDGFLICLNTESSILHVVKLVANGSADAGECGLFMGMRGGDSGMFERVDVFLPTVPGHLYSRHEGSSQLYAQLKKL